MNGSPAATMPVSLEGVDDPSVLTLVTASRAGEDVTAPRVADCLRRAGIDRPSGTIVLRVGVAAETVTFRHESLRGLYACDDGEGPSGVRRRCGVAFGHLYAGRLRDPRLDLGACRTDDGAMLGFAWIQPDQHVKYVAVRQNGYVEVYETAAGLPVRVTTTDVQIEQSRALFDVSEHAADGGLVREYRLETSVAG